jgi:hypothetical protein
MTVITVLALIAWGGACALGVVVYGYLRVRRSLIRKYPELQARWCALDCQTRRHIRRALNRGEAPAVEHAALALEILDVSDAEHGTNFAAHRNRLRKARRVYGVGLVVGAFLIGFAHEEGAAIGIMGESYCATLAAIALFAHTHAKRIAGNRPAARAATLSLRIVPLSRR